MRYRVNTYGGMDGLHFPDLQVRYSTGYLLPLKIKEGEYIPLEILDPLDVKKSLLAGSLGKYIASGDVVVEDDEIVLKATPKKRQLAEIVSNAPEFPQQPEISTKEEAAKVIEQPIVEQVTSLSAVKTIADFTKLGYFLKLRFIKECNDKALLQELFSKLDSRQLKNNIQLKLSQLG